MAMRPAYASDLEPGNPGGLVELAQKHVANGFRAMKFGWALWAAI